MSDIILESPFLGHIDESVREEIADTVSVNAEAVNIRQDEQGGAQKRLGFNVLALTRVDGTSRSAGSRIIASKQVHYVLDGSQADSFDPTSASSAVVGRTYSAYVNKYIEATSSLGQLSLGAPADIAYANGYLCVVWASDGDLKATLIHAATGTIVMAPTTAISGGSVKGRVAAYGSVFIVVGLAPASATVTAKYLEVTSRATIAAGWTAIGANVGTDHAATDHGFAIHGLTDRVVFAYSSSTPSEMRVKTLDKTGVLATTNVTTDVATPPGSIALGGSSSDRIWVAFDQPTDIICVTALNPTTLAVVGTKASHLTLDDTLNIIHICHGTTAGTARLTVHDVTDKMYFQDLSTSGTTINLDDDKNIFNLVPLGPPFAISGRYYQPMSPVGIDRTQRVVTICDITDFDINYVVPVANLEPFMAVAHGSLNVQTIAGASTTTRYFPFATIRSVSTAAVLVAEVDFASRNRWLPAAHGNAIYLAGAAPAVIETTRIPEIGFYHSPDTPTLDASVAGAISYVNGGARYAVVFYDRDDRGNVVIGGVSLPSAASGNTVSKRITITTRRLTMGQRAGSYQAVFFATADGGQPPYYRIGVGTDAGASVTFEDNVGSPSGALLYGTGALPGTGAGQDRRTIGAVASLTSYNSMLIGATGPDLWWSGQFIRGEHPWFNPIFTVPVSDDGDIVVIPQLDGTLFPMSRNGIYAISGEPPADNGTQGGLGSPRKLASEVGCIDPNSVVVTSMGIFFQSSRGLELLDRSQTLAPFNVFGAKVQNSIAAFPVCSSAVLDTRNGLVRFTMTTTESAGLVSGTGITLVYDLSIREWVSKDLVPSNEAIQSAAVIYYSNAYRYAWLGTDGEVHYERDTADGSAYLDGSTWITQRVVTAWMHPAGINGENVLSELLLLAKQYTGHDLTISIGFDYASSYASTRTFTAAQIAALANEWISREISQTTCTAVRFKFEDATPSSGSVGTGRGAAWIARTIKGVAKPGMKRTSGAQRGA